MTSSFLPRFIKSQLSQCIFDRLSVKSYQKLVIIDLMFVQRLEGNLNRNVRDNKLKKGLMTS